MLSPKQASYINLGLQDRLKCVYYCPEDKDYVVYINSNNDKTISSVIYGIKFEDNQKAEYFAKNYIIYDNYEFDILVTLDSNIIIEPRTIDGTLKIKCSQNEEMAKKLVKRFRTQNIERLNRQKRTEKCTRKIVSQDFRGMKF